MSKLAPCKGGGRHKWIFKRNHIATSFGAYGATVSAKGWYRCEVCNQGKTGSFQHEFSDLNEANQEKGHGATLA